MDIAGWIELKPISSFQAAQLLLIAGGLGFTAIQVRRTARSVRVTNLLSLTRNHRELWGTILEAPQLRAVLHSTRAVTSSADLSLEERLLVNFFLLHMASAYELQRHRMITRNRAFGRDMAGLVCLPAFEVLWRENAHFHPPRFRRFLNRAIRRYKATPEPGIGS